MKHKIIRQPALNVTHIIIYLIMCVTAVWINIDNKANIENILQGEANRYIIAFLFLIVVYFEMAQFLTMENCQNISKFKIFIYYCGITFIMATSIVSLFYKYIYFFILCCIGVIVSAIIIIHVIKRNGIPRYLKITIDEFVKIKNDKEFQNFSIIMAISQIVNFVACIIIFKEENSVKLVNYFLISWLVIIVALQIIKTYRIPNFIPKKKERYIYNIISPIIGISFIIFLNNIFLINNSNLYLGVFSVAIVIVTTISSDIEIYYKIVLKKIQKNNRKNL